MRKWLGFTVLIATMALALAGTAWADGGDGNGNGNGSRFGPYDSTSPDSGTCGNDWAQDTFQRVFTVSGPNADGTYTVREDFKHGSFVTLVGPSPGACETNPGGTIAPGVRGKMHGYEVITVTGGTLVPDATCPADCTTAGFIAAAFGPGATFTVGTYFFTYSAGDQGLCAHHWRNASPDRGGNAGDIATTCSVTFHDGHGDGDDGDDD